MLSLAHTAPVACGAASKHPHTGAHGAGASEASASNHPCNCCNLLTWLLRKGSAAKGGPKGAGSWNRREGAGVSAARPATARWPRHCWPAALPAALLVLISLVEASFPLPPARKGERYFACLKLQVLQNGSQSTHAWRGYVEAVNAAVHHGACKACRLKHHNGLSPAVGFLHNGVCCGSAPSCAEIPSH